MIIIYIGDERFVPKVGTLSSSKEPVDVPDDIAKGLIKQGLAKQYVPKKTYLKEEPKKY